MTPELAAIRARFHRELAAYYERLAMEEDFLVRAPEKSDRMAQLRERKRINSRAYRVRKGASVTARVTACPVTAGDAMGGGVGGVLSSLVLDILPSGSSEEAVSTEQDSGNSGLQISNLAAEKLPDSTRRDLIVTAASPSPSPPVTASPSPFQLTPIEPATPVRQLGRRTIAREARYEDYPGFVEFWGAYPKKVGKREALGEWVRQGLESLTDEIVDAIGRQKLDAKEWRFRKDPAGWLGGRRWEDEARPEIDLPERPPTAAERQTLRMRAFYEKHGIDPNLAGAHPIQRRLEEDEAFAADLAKSRRAPIIDVTNAK